jgi:apolipoprotein N-acyltransferase
MKLNKIFAAGYAGDCLALISGILLTFAFAPFNAAPLAVVSPMLILCLWLPVSRVRALYRGWLFGLGFFGSGVYWVFISIHTYGNASVALSAVITCGFILILACFPALTGFVLTRNFPINNNTKILCAFPALWSFLEWIRGWIFTGFPWLSLGYSQINTPLRGYAPLVGVYGLSLLVLLSSSLLLTAILNISSRKKIMFAYKNIFALVLIWVMGGLLNYVSWTRPLADPVKVSLVQGNIPQQLKWSPEELLPTLTRYVTLTKEHLDSSIIIWPEGAVPMSIQAAREFLTKISIMAAHYHTTIITGIPIQASALGGYNNGVIAMGNGTGIYLKQRRTVWRIHSI